MSMQILFQKVQWGLKFCICNEAPGLRTTIVEQGFWGLQTFESRRRTLRAEAGWCCDFMSKDPGLFLFLPHIIQVLSAGSRNTWLWGHKFTQKLDCFY